MEKINIHKNLKKTMAEEDITFVKVVELLNQKYDKNYSVANLHKKIKSKTVKYEEIEMILDILGYDLIWEKK